MITEGQIALMRFPYTDNAANKLRPVLILRQLPTDYKDWLICMISSQLWQESLGTDSLVHESDDDFLISGLKTTSLIRVTRLAVVNEKQLDGAIGTISLLRLNEIKDRLMNWLVKEVPRDSVDQGENHDLCIIVGRDNEGYLVGTTSSLPGCHTQARSVDELMLWMRDAVDIYMETI